MGLLVHQNYIKIAVKPFLQTKMKGDANAEHQALVDLYKGTEAMSDYAVAEHGVRSGDQNWGLLPFCAILSLKSGYHCGGENGGFLPGFPEFSSWLGKNSSRGKRDRLLQEFGHHMNYKISADKTELRLGYLPAIRDQFVNLMMPLGGDGPNVEDAIGLMDDYGLDRDDIFENIDEFVLDRKTKRFADLDSKTKSAFTREYNKGVHKSQALIEEQGAPSRKRKKIVEEDDEDNEGEDNGDDDDDDGLSPDEIRKMFASKKSGKKKATPKPKKSKK
jgi:replication factor C subunit 1